CKKSLDTGKASFAFHDQLLLITLQFAPRDIERNIVLPDKLLEVGKPLAVLGLGPGFNRALAQAFGRIRNDQVQIKINRIAESLAARAGAKRAVEGKQPRLRLFIADVAGLTLKARGKAKLALRLPFARNRLEQHLRGFAIRKLYGIHDA